MFNEYLLTYLFRNDILNLIDMYNELDNKELETFQIIHNRGGVDSAEVEHLLMVMYNQNTYIVNKILEKWNKE